ncbi:MAG: AraC family transcriptional regulator [Clostridiales bacterium]|nr:AraC family transcriptional regulator [Clostridiales bacterium]
MIENLNGTRETVTFNSSHTIRFYRNDEPEDYPEHWHLPGEIIAPLSSSYEVVVAKTSVVLHPGDILIISPSEMHSILAPPTGVRYIVNFDATYLEQFQDFSFLLSTLRPYCLITKEDAPQLSQQLLACLTDMETEYFGETPYRDAATASLLLRFFLLLGRHTFSTERIHGSTQSKQQEYTERFTAVCNYINKHCTEDLTLETISEYAGFSKFHFSRLFKEFSGTTFHNYLTNSRILWAKGLLADSSVSITEISMRSGFNSLATFNRVFKEQMGCTPSEYRKMNTAI